MIKTILPYKWTSESAHDLASAVGIKCIRPGGIYVQKSNHLIINWGNGSPHFSGGTFINHPDSVRLASNKLDSFCKFLVDGVPTVDITLDPSVANQWLTFGHKVVCRTLIAGCGGKGVSLAMPGDVIPVAKFYTKYQAKEEEYRVHIFGGKVLDYGAKRRRSSGINNEFVRNYDNGWVFCRDGEVLPDCVAAASRKAVASLGLHFGACDVIYKAGKAFVLEVNTAPGLEGTTLHKYKEAVRAL